VPTTRARFPGGGLSRAPPGWCELSIVFNLCAMCDGVRVLIYIHSIRSGPDHSELTPRAVCVCVERDEFERCAPLCAVCLWGGRKCGGAGDRR